MQLTPLPSSCYPLPLPPPCVRHSFLTRSSLVFFRNEPPTLGTEGWSLAARPFVLQLFTRSQMGRYERLNLAFHTVSSLARLPANA